MKLSVNAVSVLAYLLAIAVLYLASSYLGGMFISLYIAVVALPLLSLLHVAVVTASLRIDQRLDEDAPEKGDQVHYAAWIENASRLPVPELRAKMVLSWPGSEQLEDEVIVPIAAGQEFSYQRSVVCSHRGMYRIGFNGVWIGDMLGMVTLRRATEYLSFYVYPRIVDVRFTAAAVGAGGGAGLVDTLSRSSDPTQLRGLTEYQRDQPMKHIAWRKFAAHGIPYIKEYDSSQRPATVIYLDLRNIDAEGERRLSTDDCSVEILVAVVKSLIEADIPVEVYGFGARRYEAKLSSRGQFRRFYLSTRLIEFGGENSPLMLMASHYQRRSDRPESALIITHRVDEPVVSMLRGHGMAAVAGIVNLVALTESERLVARRLAQQVRIEGGAVRLVEDSDHIAEGLFL